jgi:hypothetical protein
MTDKKDEPVRMDTNKKFLLIIGILFLAVIFLVGYSTIVSSKVNQTYDIMDVRQVERQFIDLNGDGRLDLLLSGEAIYNGVPLEPTPSQ